jgi:hypothetical protein
VKSGDRTLGVVRLAITEKDCPRSRAEAIRFGRPLQSGQFRMGAGWLKPPEPGPLPSPRRDQGRAPMRHPSVSRPSTALDRSPEPGSIDDGDTTAGRCGSFTRHAENASAGARH